MFAFLKKARSLPSSKLFGLKSYSIDFSLDRLMPGVDNIRQDVFLSTTFVATARKIIAQLIARQAGVDPLNALAPQTNWAKEVHGFKQHYLGLMHTAVNRAKAQREIQIEHLAQAAVWKMMIEEVRSQFDLLVGHLKRTVRKIDLSEHTDQPEAPKLKEHLQRILQERETIVLQVGLELFGFIAEVEIKTIQPMHVAIFGTRSAFVTDLLGNPLLHLEQADTEFFRLAEYDITMGRRIEDLNKYEALLFLLRQLIQHLDLREPDNIGLTVDRRLSMPALQEEVSESRRQAYHQLVEGWLKEAGNIDLLFNWQVTQANLQAIRKARGGKEQEAKYKQLLRQQKRVLDFFYEEFRKNSLLERIVASYEMRPEYLAYCPPLAPQQIVQYLLFPKTRKVVRSRLLRLHKLYSRDFSLRPLNRKIKSMEQMTTAKRKAYLVRFLKSFVRYHRDICNRAVFREAAERVRLAKEDKILTLSRENNTLYEFLLPHEQVSTKALIINHVVIKADVRGSTDITHQMNTRGLNPASYFSLNFFDPISEILSEYGAHKIFIEGDAIILSIFERENTPDGWYSVARACGIALRMLIIIQHYNEKNVRNRLPILELGIGISYTNAAPTFLFDGNNRIMISSAINHADRLSSCSKTGRKLVQDRKGPFNLYVFQTLPDEALAATSDDLLTRFNVNGIELNAQGFEKLSNEIDLKLVKSDIAFSDELPFNLYSGTFPTKSGHYQRLIVRESQIPIVDPNSLKRRRISSRKYYEVCTHPKLYKMLRHADD